MTKFNIGEKVWFIAPMNQKAYFGTIISVAPNGCYTVDSGKYQRMKFEDELFNTQEEALKTLNKEVV